MTSDGDGVGVSGSVTGVAVAGAVGAAVVGSGVGAGVIGVSNDLDRAVSHWVDRLRGGCLARQLRGKLLGCGGRRDTRCRQGRDRDRRCSGRYADRAIRFQCVSYWVANNVYVERSEG